MVVTVFTITDVLKNPPTPATAQNGSAKEFHWSMPRLSPQEKSFVSQLITSPSKEVIQIFSQLACRANQ